MAKEKTHRDLTPVERHRVKSERAVLLRDIHLRLAEISGRLQSTGDTGPWPAEAWSSWGSIGQIAREIVEVARAKQLLLAGQARRFGTHDVS